MKKDKKSSRLRRTLKTRAKIRALKKPRLCVYRSAKHVYAQIILSDSNGDRTVASASSLDKDIREQIAKLKGKVEVASVVGQVIAKQAVAKEIKQVAFDRSGYKYHGRVKAVAEGAREGGLEF